MMKSITIKESWKTRLDTASGEWKAGEARTKFRSTVLAFLLSQRESAEPGFKNCTGMPCVPIPANQLRSIYADSASSKKFIAVCERHGLAVRDRSWVSPGISELAHQDARCDRWHFTEPEAAGKAVEEFFDTSYGLCAKFADWLAKVDGLKWGLDEFHGKWAMDAFNSGELGWKDFAGCAVVAKSILDKGFEDGVHEYREYTPLAMCPKHLRGKCFVRGSTGDGVAEFFDLNACITFCAPVGAAIVSDRIGYTDTHVVNYFYRLELGDTGDVYKRIFKHVNLMDPCHDWYGSKGEWTDAVRKKLKTDVQVVFNETLEWVDGCRRAYMYEVPDIKWWDSRRRRWLVWMALYKACRECWEVSLVTKINGSKGGFFRTYAAAEKCVFGVIRELLEKRGYQVHRLHDSIWTSDPRLKRMSPREAGMMVGRMFQDWMREQETDEDWRRRSRTVSPTAADLRLHVRRMAAQRLTESELNGLVESIRLDRPRMQDYRRRVREAGEWWSAKVVPS